MGERENRRKKAPPGRAVLWIAAALAAAAILLLWLSPQAVGGQGNQPQRAEVVGEVPQYVDQIQTVARTLCGMD